MHLLARRATDTQFAYIFRDACPSNVTGLAGPNFWCSNAAGEKSYKFASVFDVSARVCLPMVLGAESTDFVVRDNSSYTIMDC